MQIKKLEQIIDELAWGFELNQESQLEPFHLTYRFLKRRLKEYTEIKAQIQTLSTELADQNPELADQNPELADQNPELLSDLDFKDILSLSPER